MKIEIKVFPGAKKNLVKNEGEILKVYLTALPVDGKANHALIGILAEYFGVRRSQVAIMNGLLSRQKTININT